METSVYLKRMNRVKEGMSKQGIDAFLVSPSSNLFYLTGYAVHGDERLLVLVLPREGEPFLLANLLYKEQVKLLPVKDFVYWKDGEEPFGLLKKEIEKRNIPMKKAALEPEIPAFFVLPINQTFPEATFVLGSPLTEPLRQIKDESELELIRRACKEADKALGALINKGSYWVGKTEAEFCRELATELNRGGVNAFGASVQAGENSAIPHYTTGNAIIEKGKNLLIDYWGSYAGYFTDSTRTFHFGRPDKEFEKVYAIVLEAHLAAEAAARPGNVLGDVDLAARSVIEKYGYGEYFTHRLGHGLGIDVHEGASANKGVNVPIEPGMVFSIEPGIYLPGKFGVRIENLVAINKKGPEVLHTFPRELVVIE